MYLTKARIACLLPSLVLSCVASADDLVVLRNDTAQVAIAVGGGGIVDFSFLDDDTNPLNWTIGELESPVEEGQPYLRGHFLCLDRWGAPSEAEAKNGVPFHGEAPRVMWQVGVGPRETARSTQMSCKLPLAGLTVQRSVRLADNTAVLTVVEEVTNTNKRGRIYNMVQHPSIAPPFLDDTTLVDSNARHGFLQDGKVPGPTRSENGGRGVVANDRPVNVASKWPIVVIDGQIVDLRNFTGGKQPATGHDVSSFVFPDEEEYGWVTACNPRRRLLLGYIWRTADYPWLNIWRYRRDGQVAARGLEFGTTGYHQPFGVLVKTGRILDRPLFEFIDASQSISKSYAAFLLRIPNDYAGVRRVDYSRGQITVTERRDESPRELIVAVGDRFLTR